MERTAATLRLSTPTGLSMSAGLRRELSRQLLPGQARLVLIVEFFERLTYYSIKSTLFLYLVTSFGQSREDSVAYVHGFIFLSYLSTVLGGILPDTGLGKLLSVCGCFGLYLLGVLLLFGSSVVPSTCLLKTGLVLVSLSAGCIKPSVSSLGGAAFGEEDQAGISFFFTTFYFSVNLSSALAIFGMPWLAARGCFGQDTCYSLGYSAAFGSLLLALAAFLVILAPSAVAIFCRRRSAITDPKILPSAQPAPTAQLATVVAAAVRLLPLSLGWLLYDQQSSTWIDQARRLNPVVSVLGRQVTLTVNQLQLVNSLGIIAMLPVFSKVSQRVLARLSLPSTPPHQLVYGLICFSAAFGAACLLELLSLVVAELSLLWQLPQLVLITVGEAFIGATGLSWSYTMAPPRYKTLMLSCWYLNMALGNLLAVGGAKLFQRLACPPATQSLAYFGLSVATVFFMAKSLAKSATAPGC